MDELNRQQSESPGDPSDQTINKVMEKLDDANQYFIVKVAEQIRAIGELNPTSVNRIILMTQMGTDIADITARLQAAIQITSERMMQLYQQTLDSTYHDPRFADALKHTGITKSDRARINQYARAVSIQTARQIENLSNTTVIEDTYRTAIDKAIIAVSAGLSDYGSATREVVRALGKGGLQVQYPSGYHRRLDTAVRQNIIDGTKQIAQHCSDMMGDALGYDAYEISAHAMSAPDHEPVQGHVFLRSEYSMMQQGQPFMDIDGNKYDGFPRPIGEWNCRHFAMSFSTEYSTRKWTPEQLAEFIRQNQAGCEIDGRHYTLYGVSQLMRRLETEVRYEKDTAIAAKAAGDDTLRRECQMRINARMQKYNSIAALSGLSPRRERTSVDGFRMVKV